MHSTRDLTSASFAMTIAGRPASLNEIFPDFDEHDRLGVVLRQPCGALGASTLLLAAITAFYDHQRARSDTFFIYPDYYLFHVGQRLGDHAMLDIWPGHKEVVTPDDPEQLVRALNDRAITRLLVEDGPPATPTFERQTLASAHQRLRTALAYAPHGRVAQADVTVAGNAATDGYVAAVLARSVLIDATIRATIGAARATLLDQGRPVEHFRRLDLDEALARLG